MAVLPILRYPDERLHRLARPVVEVDESVRALVRDMAETMYAAPGIGLAAVQVGDPRQVVVIDISEARDELRTFINPVIVEAAGTCEFEEGCLSVPGIYETVRRAARVKTQSLDERGRPFELVAEGLLAVCIQHEIDHLHGRVFVEHLSRLKQSRILAKLKKQQRLTM